jgi:hypothetical protein
VNIARSAGATPSVSSAGPFTTHAMMNEAVTGTASPSTPTATAESSTVRISTTVALIRDRPGQFHQCVRRVRGPGPVFVIVEVMAPAAAHTAITGSAPRTPIDSASTMSLAHPRAAPRRAISENSAATPVT